MIEFPRHKAGLHLTHNHHKDYYESVEDYLKNPWMEDCDISEEDKQWMIKEDSVWELQWYPDTPIGSYKVVGATLERVLADARAIEENI